MIKVKHLSKSFGDTVLLDDFNYTFLDHRFYLLFGPSGCGKTTLLNMLAKIYIPDEGFIDIDENDIAYITQDCYFVDYLTVYDNLHLYCDDDMQINNMLEQFQLKNILSRFPSSLSGGEKQRLSIVRARLSNANILLLDEPTAALDKENSELVFHMLRELSECCTIICVSHDPEAKSYCDAWIDFENLHKYKIDMDTSEMKLESEIRPSFTKKNRLFPYIKKQASYYKENKQVSIFLIGLFSLVLLVYGVLSNTTEKLLSSLGSDNHINAVQIICDIQYKDECLKGIGTDVEMVVYPYSQAAQYFELQKPKPGESASIESNYMSSLLSITLPANKSLYKLSDKIEYGSYPQKKDEVMIGYGLAEKLAINEGIDMQSIIGKVIQIETAHGLEKFIVQGITSSFLEADDAYLRTLGSSKESADRSYFFHQSYALEYYDDGIDSQGEKENGATFWYYFNDFDDVQSFENEVDHSYLRVIPTTVYFLSIITSFENYNIIMTPILYCVFLLSLLFYVFIRNVQMKYAKHIYSVYELGGYSIRQIRSATYLFYISHLTKIFVISTMVSLSFGYLLIFLNQKFRLVPFHPYLFDWHHPLLLYGSLLTVTALFVFLQFHNHKHISAYDRLKERRDLL